MRRDTPYLSVFSWNVRKYGPEKTPYLDTFRVVPFPEKKLPIPVKGRIVSQPENKQNSCIIYIAEIISNLVHANMPETCLPYILFFYSKISIVATEVSTTCFNIYGNDLELSPL